MIWYHELKVGIGHLTSLDQNVLHIFLGVSLYVLAVEMFRIRPVSACLLALAFGCANELIDYLNSDELGRAYSIKGGAKDLLLTIAVPLALAMTQTQSLLKKGKVK